MSVLTQRANESNAMLMPREQTRYYAWLSRGLSAGALVLAALVGVAALVLALDYRSQPFLGVLTDRELYIQEIGPFGDQADWPGLDVGMMAGDQIIGANEVEFSSDEPYKELDAILEDLEPDDTMQLIVARDSDEGGIPQADSCQLNDRGDKTICFVSLGLVSFPTIDLLGYFGVGYLMGLVALGLSAFLLWRNFKLVPSQLLAAAGAAIAVTNMGVFNLLTTRQPEMVLLWSFAGTMLGGIVISFSMVFPNRMPLTERIPALRYASLVIGLILTVIVYAAYTNGADLALALPLVFIGTGTATMVAIMLWRRQYTTSPIYRERASYVMMGALFGVVPVVAWIVFQVSSEGDAPVWGLPLVQVMAIFFLLSAYYAIMQERLLESDRLIPAVVLYSVLGALLVLAYAAVVFGLSLIGLKSVESDSPLFIGLTVLAIAFGFVPVRSRLQNRIDEIWFRRRRQYQQRIETLTSNLTNALTLRDVEQAIRTELFETLAPSEVIMFVRDAEAQVYRAQSSESSSGPASDVTFPFDSGLAGYLENEASILYLEAGNPLPPQIIQNRAQLAVLNTPVIVRLLGQRHLNGFVAVGLRRSGEVYTFEDLQFIEKAADQAALALERTQVVEDMEHRFRVQDVLSQVSRALSYAIDLDTLMELLYAQTSRVIETDVFSIAIVSADGNQVSYAFYVEGDERLEHLENQSWEIGRDLISEVARTQGMIRTEDYVATSYQYNPNAKLVHTNIKAWMGAPLTADTETGTLGVMSVGTTDPSIRYSDEQVQLLLDIASIAASAITKTRLFEATQARTQQLEALNAISSRLSTEIADVDRLLDLITRSAIEILNCQAGSLLLEEEETGDMVFQVAMGPDAQALVGKRISRDSPSLTIEALNRAEPIIVNDTMTDNRWYGEVLDHDAEDDITEHDGFQSRAILTTPLLAQGEPIGVLQVINKKDRSLFTNEDATLLTTFAAQAAVAIQNARLYALQDERLIQRVAELEGLAAIDQSLNQTLELRQVVEIALDWAIRQSSAKAGALAMMTQEGDGEGMLLIASRGYPEDTLFAEEAVGQEIPTNIGIWGRVIRSSTPAFARNLQGDPEAGMPGDPDYVETLPGAVSQIVVPIISANEVIGMLIVESDNDTDLTLLDMEFLTRLADHASPAITNSQLFGELSNQQKARADFVRFIAHELGNPMTSMKGYADLLMRGVVGPLNEQQSNFLETILNNINRLEVIVSDLRDVEAQEVNQLSLDMSSVNFPQIVRECLRSLQQGFEKKEQEVILDFSEDLPQIWAAQDRLVQIMTNFLTNANKYTPVNGKVTVSAEEAVNIWDTEGVRRVLHVQVKDTGIGISEEDLKRLFKEKYFRTENAKDTDEPGTGLGMVLTRGLILQHGGQVWVESELNVGSTFHFTLPLAEEIMREAM